MGWRRFGQRLRTAFAELCTPLTQLVAVEFFTSQQWG
jgi:hypothetical protein